MPTIEQQLADARFRLLDLGLRNRLLNHRLSKRRTVTIVDEMTHEVYDILVLQGKKMRFLPSAKEAQADLSPDGVDDKEGESGDNSVVWLPPDHGIDVDARHTDLALQTNLDPEALQKKLFHVSAESESVLEEQGYTVLYIALGFLEWYESPDSDLPRRAPLILVPVALERQGVRQAFKLRWTEEDVDENISLRAKLGELGVELPEFPSVEDKREIVQYFEKVTRAIAEKTRWRIVTDIVLDFFSFTKFVMYKDLDPKAWPEGRTPAESGVLADVLLPSGEEIDTPGFDPDSIDLLLKLSDLYHVVDADPSQIAVIEDAKAGRCLVVEGPPGTGKSQTITNIIAELLAAGKKVLFVSEKMAALSVVKDRLEKVGLGAFCVEVHSRKASRKGFLEQLEQAARIRFPKPEGVEREFAQLEELRDQLNDYAEALRQPVGSTGVSPAQAFQDRERANAHFLETGRKMMAIQFEGSSDWTLDQKDQCLRVLDDVASAAKSVSPIETNPWRGSNASGLLPPDVQQIEREIQDVQKTLRQLGDAIAKLADSAGVRPAAKLADIQSMLEAARVVEATPDIERSAVVAAVDGDVSDRVSMIDVVVEFAKLSGQTASIFVPGAMEADVKRMIEELRARAHRLFRWFDGQYRALRREIAALYQSGRTPKNELALIQLGTLAKAIGAREQIRGYSPTASKAFGSAWHGDQSDAETLRRIDEWLNRFVRGVERKEITEDAIDRAVDSSLQETIHTVTEHVEEGSTRLLQQWSSIVKLLAYDESWLPESDIKNELLHLMDRRFTLWLKGVPVLTAWSSFVTHRDRAESTPAAPLVEFLMNGAIHVDDLPPTYEGNLAESLLREAFEARPAMAGFSAEVHESRIEKFANLDRRLVETNRLRLAALLSDRRPPLPPGADPTSDAGIILGQFNKKKGHLKIRELMGRCGNLIKDIVPCFMMSPLSVAQFLDPRVSHFDVVIFDEASQVRPEEALGALMRANQALVIGDTKQLPPTSFFDHVVDGPDDGDDDAAFAAVGEMESILHQCRRSFPTKRLTWHYRSQHESLIAVSNQKFYNNELKIYPSPIASASVLGIQHCLLADTVYDRGRSGVNRKEAHGVAEAVIRHYETSPDETLGVGAFSVKQQQAIMEEVEALRRTRPDLDSFFTADCHEHFFVKNLETIQGDERDVIFVSLGYGFDAAGMLNRNFGPVNLEGGERRLNVLFTRARRRCVVFSNFGAEHLRIDDVKSRGVRILRAFLEYAATRVLIDDVVPGGDADSPFEDSVAAVLRAHDYDVAHQVGCAGFRVDLAVRDAREPGRYMIGIECDGWKYHSTPVARDRDRLRQQILEARGWRIHRIWSTDWYRSRAEAERKLLQAVDDAKNASSEPPANQHDTSDPGVNPMDYATLEDFEDLEAPEYETCNWLRVAKQGELHEQPRKKLREIVETVVRVEAPVHQTEVVRRIRILWGIGRAGKRIQTAIASAIRDAVSGKTIIVRDEFLFWRTRPEVPVRKRVEDPKPDIKLICAEEIAEAAKQVLEAHVATPHNGLIMGIARLFGIKSTRVVVTQRIGKVIDSLIADGVIVIVAEDGRLRLAGEE